MNKDNLILDALKADEGNYLQAKGNFQVNQTEFNLLENEIQRLTILKESNKQVLNNNEHSIFNCHCKLFEADRKNRDLFTREEMMEIRKKIYNTKVDLVDKEDEQVILPSKENLLKEIERTKTIVWELKEGLTERRHL